MHGYDEEASMSWRAQNAYDEGMLPAAKMVNMLKKKFPRSFKGLTVRVFRDVVGSYGDEWHHTGKGFNKTEFYSLSRVFRFRRELKAMINVDVDALKSELASCGRTFLVTEEGTLWMPVSFANFKSLKFVEAARAALRMADTDYAALIERHNAEIAELNAKRAERC